MSTLNLKVLLNKTKLSLLVSTIIWFSTSLLGTTILLPTGVTDMPFYQLLIISLIFSIPAQLIIASAVWLGHKSRYQFSLIVTITALSCIVVIISFLIITNNYPLDNNTTVRLLTPYVVASAIVAPLVFSLLNSLKKFN
jgi:hypothetical protein